MTRKVEATPIFEAQKEKYGLHTLQMVGARGSCSPYCHQLGPWPIIIAAHFELNVNLYQGWQELVSEMADSLPSQVEVHEASK